MNQIFNLQRAYQFSLLKFNLNRKKLLISLGGIFGLIFIITFFMANILSEYNVSMMNNFHHGAYTLLIFAGAVWLAGHAYQDMNTSEKSITQLMIPASRFEKYLIPLVFTSLIWIVSISLVYLLYANALNGLWGLLFSKNFEVFSITELTNNIDWVELIQSYFLAHSIFFLGGLAFRTYPIGKTILTGFIVNVIFTSLAFITGLILFGNSLENFDWQEQNIIERYPEIFNEDNYRRLQFGVKVFFTTILPTIFYVAAYYKLKEREA